MHESSIVFRRNPGPFAAGRERRSRTGAVWREPSTRTRGYLALYGGEDFPSVYFEHPLAGKPFLDVTVLLNDITSGTRVESPVTGEHAAMLDWYASVRQEHDDICCGFELDTKEDTLPTAAIHFQPRAHTELVRPFCEIVGEPERATFYLDMAARMPGSWPLSFFGMFRGREAAPLRVCGYLSAQQKHICARNPSRLAKVFDTVGFTAYDRAMLEQISMLMAAAPEVVDFQFDVYPDGSLGDTFALTCSLASSSPRPCLPALRMAPALASWTSLRAGAWRTRAGDCPCSRSLPAPFRWSSRMGRSASLPSRSCPSGSRRAGSAGRFSPQSSTTWRTQACSSSKAAGSCGRAHMLVAWLLFKTSEKCSAVICLHGHSAGVDGYTS